MDFRAQVDQWCDSCAPDFDSAGSTAAHDLFGLKSDVGGESVVVETFSAMQSQIDSPEFSGRSGREKPGRQ
jgi:hypothetical protein